MNVSTSEPAAMRRTPLYDLHRELGARIVPFAGWEMPVQYGGILDEVRAVRTRAGLFDISHMGRVHITGPGSESLLDRLTTNDVRGLTAGRAQYTLLTNPHGGVIDDLIIYRAGADEFWIVINASNSEKDLGWIGSHAGGDVEIEDWTDRTAMIAVQGPDAVAMTGQAFGQDLSPLPGFSFASFSLAGERATVCRTGYTGEDGVELIVHASAAEGIWRRLLDTGAVSCGLGARDALRIEAGFPLYGHEIDDATNPVEAGLMWVVKLDKGAFTGRDRIAEAKRDGPGRRLVGLTLQERMSPRQGYTLHAPGADKPIGVVTSGVFSPTVGHSVAMAYVNDPWHRAGTELEVQIRASRVPCRVVPKKDLRTS